MIRVHVIGEQTQQIEVAVDTGFSGFISLPAQIIERLGLQPQDVLVAVLADGSEAEMQTFLAQIEWDNKVRDIYVIHAESHPLIGTALLENHLLTIEVRDGGAVNIETL